ncbi:AsmA-like C-terminal region-containing protein [Roseibium sp. SCPC15]|uniref:AsmA family protein n=1 Tax=Roseibium sp. SCP15 TaxID=3141376 RepID=UPI003334ED2A
MKQASQKQQGRGRRVLRVCGLVLAVLIVVSVGAVYAVASLEMFLPARKALADRILTSVFGRQVDVHGDVVLKLGQRLGVQIEDAFVERTSTGNAGKARVFEKIRFQAGYNLLLGEVGSISNFQMSGAEIVYRPDNPDGNVSRSSVFELPSTIVNSPVLDNLELSDVTLRFVDETDGWNETLEINSFQLVSREDALVTEIKFDATVNGTPLYATGKMPNSEVARSEGGGPFDLSFEFPGLDSHYSGTIDTTDAVAVVDGNYSASSGSITELLASLGLASEQEGKATLDWDFEGPIDQLDIRNLKVAIDDADGDQFLVTGQVEDLTKGAVFGLHFKATLVPLKPTSDTPFAVNVKEVSGDIQGPVDALEVQRAQIVTDAVLLDFDEIGPISVGRVVKHPDNRVGLKDMVVQDGPDEAPYLLMTGQIDDLMALAGVNLSGTYRFPAALLLNREANSIPELGFIEGTVSLNELSGSFGLDALTGAATDTDLFDLTFELAIPELRVVDELRFSTDLQLPDPATFLKALDVETDDTLPALSFSGSSGFSGGGAELDGHLTTGSTQIDAAIKLAPEDASGVWLLGGAISSAQMDLSDLRGLVEFAKLGVSEQDDDVQLTEEFKSALRVEVGLDVKKFVSGKKAAGNLSGTVSYDDDKLQLSKLKFDYVGGTIKGDFSIDYASAANRATAHGRMEKFRLKSLMNELGLKAPISSTVYASFDVSGNADSEASFLKSMSGSVTTSLWGGTLPNRLLDLTGMNAFTWLVTGNQEKGTKLVCAVLPLHFKNGSASTRSLIVETNNVQIVGAGSINFKSGALNLSFMPRAKRKQLVEIVSPFELKGTIAKPDLIVKDAGPGRAVGEVVSLPLNLIGHIFRGSGEVDEKARPCVLPKNTKPK